VAGRHFSVDIVTPDRQLASIPAAVSLVVPAEEGYLGVMAGHAPLLARLLPGQVTVKLASGAEEVFAVSGGFVEAGPEHVTLLADTAERPEDIDVARAEAALERARQRLEHPAEGVDIDRARMALLRAEARLTTAGRLPR
jgi:F-type H+-transporting ATPase subunit epsilon